MHIVSALPTIFWRRSRYCLDC